ncbi:endo-1,4-beta-xylanase [Acaryochloris sp. IP29b_bin.137]|uniref:endo-1,4-beta-xylanase n=1 Tax=Acaryochloris sp. IP29b_bin.137 TaxID=2969217 RepID=UPI00262A3E28|nr:endo-1,4-beta-xylanase [Acaryochloris sp. IP29b_bin.137]
MRITHKTGILLLFMLPAWQPVWSSKLGVENVPVVLVSQPRDRAKSLRQLAEKRQLTIGTAVRMEPFQNDATYRAVLAREFNSLTPENAMKFGQLSPKQGQYTFEKADALVAFAEQHQMQVHGHVLVWHRNLPNWLTGKNWSRAELIDILHKHITTVVSRYQGRVAVWDVVNEALEKDGSLRDSIWLRGIGPEYIAMAFRWAHAADPQAKLLYNDYQAEELNPKSKAVYQLVKTLLQKGVPIHGVGWQMHKGIKTPPNGHAIANNMRRLSNLGLEVKITEMDVSIHKGPGSLTEKLQRQAHIYSAVLSICLQFNRCRSFSTWGLADHHSWIPSFLGHPDAPLLFDQSYRPKPAYRSLIDILQRHNRPKLSDAVLNFRWAS